MPTRDTSAESYRSMLMTGHAAAQECRIFRYLDQQGGPRTLQEIAKDTGIQINAVSGRVNKMKQDETQVVFEWPKKTCPITDATVTPVWTQKPLPLFGG